ncbi:MAG TPA: transposase [Terriglobia bacterium]|nr:transposase [Terriglobia bacterium]
MGLSRRQFTKEFKLAVLQRLETGAPVAEVARAFEVNPKVLHFWRREFRQGPAHAFPDLEKRRWEEGRVAQADCFLKPTSPSAVTLNTPRIARRPTTGENAMRRLAMTIVLLLLARGAFAQVQSVGDVSFAVPDGWGFLPGADHGSLGYTSGQNFWLMAVYTPMPSSGNATADFNAAWTRVVLAGGGYQGFPLLPYNTIAHSVGYPGLWASASSVNQATYTRLYALEAGKSVIPVTVVSRDGMTLNAAENVAYDVIGSARLAPLKAQPFQYRITIADLTGSWIHGMASSQTYYNPQNGRYEGNTSAFYGAGYDITADGRFAYKMSGMMNSSVLSDQDSGVVELSGGSVVFNGKNHVVRYRFINCQQALDGSTVLTLLPEGDQVSAITILRDGDRWSRPPRK